MSPFVETYLLSLKFTFSQLRGFDLPPSSRARYAIKAANLSLCFLGFSIHRGREALKRSAQVGMLASLFDLGSDGLHFRPSALAQLQAIVTTTVDHDTAAIIFELMERKRARQIQLCGLERGIDALRIITKHLQSEKMWESEAQFREVGILCQVVDDILDYENDLALGDLNFLCFEDPMPYVEKLLTWRFKEQLVASAYPSVLFKVILRAQAKAPGLVHSVLRSKRLLHREQPS